MISLILFVSVVTPITGSATDRNRNASSVTAAPTHELASCA
jgi:hypothetical protein